VAFCFLYGEAERSEGGDWRGVRARTACDSTTCNHALASGRWGRGVPYLLAEVSVRKRQTGSRAGHLEVSISQRKLAGFSEDGRASYERSDESREYPIEDAVTAAVPLLIADQKEKDAFRAYDVVLRFRASTAGKAPATAFGKVSVLSDTPRADILLDGGIVARTSDGAQTLLENVLAGDRELRVRDFSGREARKVVRVPTGGTVQVTLEVRAPSRPVLGNGLVGLGANPQGQQEYWRPKDGAPVVRIPAGKFLMGSPEGEGELAEHPQREVFVTDYLIDKTEVSWGQYKKFSKATGTPLPEAPLWDRPDDYPVTAVTWAEATAFCEWAGGRLPSEAEWEKAARGTDGRRYPFGDDWDPDRCNTRDGGPHRPKGVSVFPGCMSPYGTLDMAGSLWEFCQDWFDPKYYESGPNRDPKGPASGRTRVVRGGSWLDPNLSARTANRQGRDPTWRNVLHGFRCIQDVPE
jgi:formylglycine-generating enzyme required for sulfatase activity